MPHEIIIFWVNLGKIGIGKITPQKFTPYKGGPLEGLSCEVKKVREVNHIVTIMGGLIRP